MSATNRLGRTERKQSILDGATRAFATGGYAATSVSDLAAAVPVTPLIVYRHFDSKNALYRAVLERASRQLRDELRPEEAGGGLGVDARSILAAARRDPAGFSLLWRHAAREPEFAPYADDLREEAIAGLRCALESHVSAATLEWATRATFGYLIEAVLTWLEFGDVNHDEAFVKATNAALHAGVRSWSGRGRR
ncbi:MAG: TetR/AcrR family transcriptional regulator [Acidimicrobiales bacterium]